MPLRFRFPRPRDKRTAHYAILIGSEVILIGLVWWKFFWGSSLLSIWLAGSLFFAFSMVYVNNFLVDWLGRPKKEKPKDTLAERKAKHGASGGHTSRRF